MLELTRVDPSVVTVTITVVRGTVVIEALVIVDDSELDGVDDGVELLDDEEEDDVSEAGELLLLLELLLDVIESVGDVMLLEVVLSLNIEVVLDDGVSTPLSRLPICLFPI